MCCRITFTLVCPYFLRLQFSVAPLFFNRLALSCTCLASMPPRTRRSITNTAIPQGTDENKNPMQNTMHTGELHQEQTTLGVSVGGASTTRTSSFLLGV
jgi:hypothetical protein